MGYNKAFLIFRFRQTGKFVRDIPVLYLLVLSGMLVMLVYAIHDFMKEPDRAILSGIIFLGLIGILHVRRGDYHFIQLVEERPARIYCMDYCLLAIPLCLIGTLRGFYWISFFMLSGTMNIVLMILSKYASYTPDMKIRAGQIANGLSLLGMILPFLTPLTLFLLLKKYPASCHNLKTYLYAYN